MTVWIIEEVDDSGATWISGVFNTQQEAKDAIVFEDQDEQWYSAEYYTRKGCETRIDGYVCYYVYPIDVGKYYVE